LKTRGLSFPDGKRQSKFSFGGEELFSGDPNFVVIKPLSNANWAYSMFHVTKLSAR
jgi:hypothetical protein